MKRFIEHTLRGYGQLFLCNSAGSGALFLAGLIVASPSNALWSFIGGGILNLKPAARTCRPQRPINRHSEAFPRRRKGAPEKFPGWLNT